jgi:hypothetical protein
MQYQLRATDIAPLTNRHTYRSGAVALRDLVQSFSPHTDPQEQYIKGLTNRIENEVRRGPVYQYVVTLPELEPGVCRRAEAESMRVLRRFLHEIPQEHRSDLKRTIRTTYLKDRGTRREIHTLRRLPSVGISWYPTSKSHRFFSAVFHAGDVGGIPVSYTVNGCIDGVEFDAERRKIGLIEVKMRRDKASIAVHDLDQIMMYLVLSSLPQARFVQDVNGHLVTDFIMTLEDAQRRWAQVQPVLNTVLIGATRQILALCPRRCLEVPPYEPPSLASHPDADSDRDASPEMPVPRRDTSPCQSESPSVQGHQDGTAG